MDCVAATGHEVVIVKNGMRVCGSGGALASAPLVQSKSYFEVKLQQSGVWGVGLATRMSDMNRAPGGSDDESWVLCSDAIIRHSNKELAKISPEPQEGDILVRGTTGVGLRLKHSTPQLQQCCKLVSSKNQCFCEVMLSHRIVIT
ncbi:unnamed protein product [Timema podura]|uniref:SPRY domain-containing protein 7 n=1 Tax=Timema podura TaxID=61482 RepID=A0ABN7PJD9_TIMPD|nr:unnamed protein product [Timema podura]